MIDKVYVVMEEYVNASSGFVGCNLLRVFINRENAVTYKMLLSSDMLDRDFYVEERALF